LKQDDNVVATMSAPRIIRDWASLSRRKISWGCIAEFWNYIKGNKLLWNQQNI